MEELGPSCGSVLEGQSGAISSLQKYLVEDISSEPPERSPQDKELERLGYSALTVGPILGVEESELRALEEMARPAGTALLTLLWTLLLDAVARHFLFDASYLTLLT